MLFWFMGSGSNASLPLAEKFLPSDLSLTTPIRLSIAAKLSFPDGSMTASGLRREAKRGHLVVKRIAGKDYTTLAAIDRMRELCRLEAKAPDCISAVRDVTKRDATHRSGSSATETVRQAQAALRMTLAELNEPSQHTSRRSTRQPRVRRPATRK